MERKKKWPVRDSNLGPHPQSKVDALDRSATVGRHRYYKVCYSDVSAIQRFIIQIPTVVQWFNNSSAKRESFENYLPDCQCE